jgi:hypothetical protein
MVFYPSYIPVNLKGILINFVVTVDVRVYMYLNFMTFNLELHNYSYSRSTQT